MPPLPVSAKLYLTALGVLALLVAGLLLSNTRLPSSDHLVLAAMVTCLLTLTLAFPLRFMSKTTLSLHTSVLFAATLLFAPGIALLIAGVGTVLADTLRRQPRDQTLFNSSHLMLQVAAGGTVLAAVGWDGQSLALTRPMIVVGLVVAATLMNLIELAAVSGIVALQTSQSPLRVWRQIATFDALEVLGQYALGIIAVIVADAQVWALLLLLALGALLYRSSERAVQLHLQTEALAHQAFHDPLTELPNRALLLDRLQHALRRAKRAPEQVGVLFVDLDDFKAINDRLGHAAGDMVLQTVGQRLRACVRPGDTVARLGGDEFVIVLDLVHGAEAAQQVAERIADAMCVPISVNTHTVRVTASIGIALDQTGTTPAEALLRDADRALYQAKAGGKAGYVVFDPQVD